MPKLAWVLLPLLPLAGWLLWRAATRRWPARPVLNAVLSLALLAYVLATAGLGLFWVAQQQLPVFDWHYLAGYVVLGLLALHLAFNLPQATRLLRRRTPAARAGARSAVPAVTAGTRRPLLAASGLAIFSAGLGYLLGRRHGAAKVPVDAAAAPAHSSPPGTAAPVAAVASAAQTAAWGLVERYHATSSHDRQRPWTTTLAFRDPPPAFKALALATAPVVLPARWRRLPERPADSPLPLDLAALGTWLWQAAGIRERRGGLALRAAPSSGALFATELYLLWPGGGGLAAGTWRYDAEGHRLDGPLSSAGMPPAASTLPTQDVRAETDSRGPAYVVATARLARSGYKYGDRAYRYVLADLGHALENLRVAAAAMGHGLRPVTAFDERRVAARLGVDDERECVLAMLELRALISAARDGADAGKPAAIGALTPAPDWTPAHTEPGVRHASLQAHAASSLRGAAAWGPSATIATPPSASPAPLATAADPLQRIALRRSTRRFGPQPLNPADVHALAQAMQGAAGFYSSAVRAWVLTPLVSGLPARVWALDAAAPELRPADDRTWTAGDLGRAARAAALDQDVVGDAAAVFVLGLDLQRLHADPLGPARGWRHAFIEAGLWGERAYLEAAVRGLGLCGVGAFYDAQAAALLGTDPRRDWLVHFIAVGNPV